MILIEINGKFFVLFVCNVMFIKVGEGFCNFIFVMFFDWICWFCVYWKLVIFVIVSIWYFFDSFNSLLKVFGVINCKFFRKKDII